MRAVAGETYRVLASDPGKRWSEKLVLWYSPVWMAIVGLLTLTRAFGHFGDAVHLAIGVGMAAPILLMPLLTVEHDRPLANRHAFRFALWMSLFSFLQCYFGSWLFFDVLGMEYHFPVTIIVNRTPLFLYFLTIAYFATYYTVMSILWRAFLRARPHAPTVVRLLVRMALGYGIAFAETGSMDNPMLRQYFHYHDKHFALFWGSIFYGTVFLVSLPFVFELNEDIDKPQKPISRVLLDILAVNMIVLMAYEVFAKLARPPA
jgi:cycloeucalenol cycloisomerase